MARRCSPANISPPNFNAAGNGAGIFVNVRDVLFTGAASALESVSSVAVVPFFTQFRIWPMPFSCSSATSFLIAPCV